MTILPDFLYGHCEMTMTYENPLKYPKSVNETSDQSFGLKKVRTAIRRAEHISAPYHQQAVAFLGEKLNRLDYFLSFEGTKTIWGTDVVVRNLENLRNIRYAISEAYHAAAPVPAMPVRNRIKPSRKGTPSCG